jgi:hypothetical protein
VCHGFNVPDFEIKIGCKKENLFVLLKKISSQDVSEEESEDKIVLILNNSEIEILERCFREVLKEIDEWEFSTRIGVSIDEATELVNKLLKSFINYNPSD